MVKTLTTKDIVNPDRLAATIANLWKTWDEQRQSWKNEQNFKRAFLEAVSTDTTQAGQLTSWKNNTTIPKLAQIKDNLHANFMALLFPNSQWLTYDSLEDSEDSEAKAKVTSFYMRHKLEQINFRTSVSKVVLDWIDGNCFVLLEYQKNLTEDDKGNLIAGFSGAVPIRIAPEDIVFNPLAPSFEESPKIIRRIKTLGDVAKDIATNPEMGYLQGVFDKAIGTRNQLASVFSTQRNKSLIDAGFGGIDKYYESSFVEILDFYGDIYDEDTGELLQNRLISVIDRSFILRNSANPSWLGKAPIYHCGYKPRSNNLWASGALDNLVGMQFQIDKLHNSKSDILDQIIHPVTIQRGFVQPWKWQPGTNIIAGDDGAVDVLRPDSASLQFANNDISLLMNLMEEMAGAPRQAMGIRTPGEKTKFEVQTLENATNRIFLHYGSYFEEEFLEKVLNGMLELNRRLMDNAEAIRMESENFNVEVFRSISKEDLAAKGSLKPRGARYFAEKANKLQDFLRVGEMLSQNPATRNHFSGKEFGEKILELVGFDNIKGLFRDNVAIAEQVSSQAFAQSAAQVVQEQQALGVPDEALAEGLPTMSEGLDGQSSIS